MRAAHRGQLPFPANRKTTEAKARSAFGNKATTRTPEQVVRRKTGHIDAAFFDLGRRKFEYGDGTILAVRLQIFCILL